jgi:PAS domain S-box-containing protein
VRDDAGERRADDASVSGPASHGRILVADADGQLAKAVGELLRERGYDAIECGSGSEALAALSEQDFDVVVVDRRLPDVDGVALLRSVRASHPTIAGILTVDAGTPGTAAELVEASGAFGYLLKPFPSAALLPMLAQAVEVRQLRRENQQLRESLSIYESANSSALTSDRAEMLGGVARIAARQADADEACILLPTPDGKSLEVVVARGGSVSYLVGQRLPIDEGIVGWVARHHAPLVLRGDAGGTGPYGAIDARADSYSSVVFPMLASQKLVGLISVGRVRTHQPFSASQIEALAVLGNVAASIVQTASLFAQARDAERKYRAIFENAIEGIYQSTLEGAFLSANSALATMYGFATPADLTRQVADIGQQLYVDPERRAALRRLLVEGQAVRGFEAQIRRNDGRLIWISESVRLVRGGSSGEVYCEGTVEDITERKNAELERERSAVALRESHQNLERALARVTQMHQQIIQQERLRALGQMAGEVAHDFNNNLAMIVGFSELLLKRPDYLANSDKVRSHLQMIRAVADDAAKVVDRLRDFSRQREEGEVFEPVDLNDLVERCMLLTQPRWRNQAQAAGVTIHVETDLQPIPAILGNVADLRDALTNLIFNAVDAMPSGGTLTIRTQLAGPRVCMEVMDTGVGMTDEVRQRCFEPFFTTKGERGSGLGLSMVYGMVQRHDGSIEVDTAPERGTTFTVCLPIAASEPSAPAPAAPVEPTEAPRRVLLVEDEAALRRILTEFLTIDRHLVETAANGQEGLEKFLANLALDDPSARFDLVITDLAMPHMSGDQLAQAIKQANPGTPVILLTGLGEMLRASGEQPEGVDLVVAKPIRMAALQRAVAQISGAGSAGRTTTNGDDQALAPV